jgi:hypothetical protein
MFDLDFGSTGGGLVTFVSLEDLVEHLRREGRLWMDDTKLWAVLEDDPGASGRIHGILHRWAEYINDFERINRDYDGTTEAAVRDMQNIASQHPAVSHSSQSGLIIRDIAMSHGPHAVVGALKLILDSAQSQIVSSMSKIEFEGALEYWARSKSLDSHSAELSRQAADSIFEFLQRRAAELHRHYDESSALLNKEVEELKIVREAQVERIKNLLAETKEDIASDRDRWQGEWDAKYTHYIEQLRLNTAVEHWEKRAGKHEASYKLIRKWTISVGLCGLIGALLASWGGVDFAKFLFSDAYATPPTHISIGGLRPTWLHELIFAAAISVLYLTIYLWLMLILVRTMMSEHHLGVDARSRESMAHTYLALLDNQGATDDKDRAIVLAALFRPVTDGLVKDDALPLLSPAAILSGQLAMPGK